MKKHVKQLTAFVALLTVLLLAGCAESNTEKQRHSKTKKDSQTQVSYSSDEDDTQAPTPSKCEKNGHIEVIDPAIQPTCGQAGLTEGKHCSVCNAVIVAQTEIPKLTTHTYRNGVCTECKELQTQGLKYSLVDSSCYAVSGIGSCKSAEIHIPAEYLGLPVKSIDSNAFKNCSFLTDVIIPDSITSIGRNAFYGCDNLTYKTWNNAKYLGNEQNPFAALIETADTSVASCSIHEQTKIIADYAFYKYSSLESLTIGNSVKNIGNFAFFGCGKLTDVKNFYRTRADTPKFNIELQALANDREVN